MKIRDAKQSYAAHRHEIWEKREALAKILKEPGGSLPSSFDRVEISKELSLLDAQYDAVDKALMGITAMETKVFGDECILLNVKSFIQSLRTTTFIQRISMIHACYSSQIPLQATPDFISILVLVLVLFTPSRQDLTR